MFHSKLFEMTRGYILDNSVYIIHIHHVFNILSITWSISVNHIMHMYIYIYTYIYIHIPYSIYHPYTCMYIYIYTYIYHARYSMSMVPPSPRGLAPGCRLPPWRMRRRLPRRCGTPGRRSSPPTDPPRARGVEAGAVGDGGFHQNHRRTIGKP